MNNNRYTTFLGSRLIITGNLETILRETYSLYSKPQLDQILIFDNTVGKQVDFNFQGTLEDVLQKNLPQKPKKGPGRPSLGVSCGEVSLLPRHWEWLQEQPKKSSATIRNLIEAAQKNISTEEKIKLSINSAGKFLWCIAGNLPEFEEATRALYAKKWTILDVLIKSWPEDIKKHLSFLLSEARNPFIEGNTHNLKILPRLFEQYKYVEDDKKEPWKLSAVKLASSIAGGTYSAVEAVESYIKRINSINNEVNAISTSFEEEALEIAEEIDRKRAAGKDVGPLAGVPFTVKENLDVANYATTNGIPAMKDAIASRDCPIVERLRKAGAIPIGHTNLPDMSLRFHTNSQLYGATLNPWNRLLTPGGSSGGEGVALATGLSALGIGNDAGGSVRIPAIFNGVTALKPSYGRLPGDRSIGPRDVTLASQVIPVDGFLARSVADLHVAFQITSGPHPVDPRTVPAPLFFENNNKKKFKVAVVTDPGGLGINDRISKEIDKVANILSLNGYLVEKAEIPSVNEICNSYGKMIFTEFYQSLPILNRLLGKDGQKYIEFAMELQKPEDLNGYLQLTAMRQGFQRTWSEFFSEYDLVIGPVFTQEIVPVDFDIRGKDEYKYVSDAMRLCSASSFIGVPAVAVTTSVNDNMPTGIQLISGMYKEYICLEAAAVIEEHIGIMTPIEPIY